MKDKFDDIKIPSNLDDVIENSFKRAKKDSKKIKFRKGAIAASITFIFCAATIATPALAARIPFIDNVLSLLGAESNYKDSSVFIGESKVLNGITYTIEEMSLDPYNAVVGVKVSSPEKIENLDFSLSVHIGEPRNSASRYSKLMVDDYTMMVIYYVQYDEELTPKNDISITVVPTIIPKEGELILEGTKLDTVSFNFKADFTKAFKDIKKLSVNISKEPSLVKDITLYSSSKDTTLIVEGLMPKSNSNRYSEESDTYYSTENYDFVLDVDGKIYHGEYGGTSSNSNDSIEYSYKNPRFNLTKDDILKAKSISLRAYKADTELFPEFNEMYYSSKKLKTKSFKYNDGTTGEVYKFERIDDVVRLYYKGEKDILNRLSDSILTYNDNKDFYIVSFGTVIPQGNNEYIVEFNNIDPNREINVSAFFVADEFIDEYKIK